MIRVQAEGRRKGAILLMVLLITSLMASLAVSIMGKQLKGIRRTTNLADTAQLDWYTKSVEDYIARYLKDTLLNTPPNQLNQLLNTGQVQTFPIEEGHVSIFIRDGSQCLSLGQLVDAEGRRQFSHLINALQIDPAITSRLDALVMDWIDSDTNTSLGGAEDFYYLGLDQPHRTANTHFSSPMELRTIPGVSEDVYQTLRPWLCARSPKDTSNININTLGTEQAPLLSAILGGAEYLNLAYQLIETRPVSGYISKEQFLASPLLAEHVYESINMDAIIFAPEFIWIEADIQYSQFHRALVLDYALASGMPKRIYRRYSEEARRPVIQRDAL